MNWPCMTELVSRHLPGKTEKKKNTTPQAGLPTSWSKFEPSIVRIQL
jgi:hypothetical protein